MTLIHIFVLCLAALLIGLSSTKSIRIWCLLVVSVLAIYWVQPATPLRHFDFWFPTITLGLAVFVWVATYSEGMANLKEELLSGSVISALILAAGVTRYLPIDYHLSPTRPPSILIILLVLIAAWAISFLIRVQNMRFPLALWPLGMLILGLFVITKTDSLALSASRITRAWTGQSSELASLSDVNWLGFSYVTMRLLHTMRDRIAGRLPNLSLREYVIYIIFFPAFTAGPIDRVERFTSELSTNARLTATKLYDGGTRIALGLFKKFVLADSLAIIALNATNARQVNSTFWLWFILYAFAFQVYFDFSGYTDVAIGIGQLVGISLPENFDRPYLKPNIASFWNSWHITLAKWFRAYHFNPLTRSLLRARWRLPQWAVIMLAQLTTMALIGLWHGIRWNFLIWGIWHGAGLFLHNRWVAFLRWRRISFPQRPLAIRAVKITSTLLTFQFVAMGWVWFALPEVETSLDVLARLLGM